MEQVTIHLEIDIYPTESEEKIKRAIWNLFGDLPVKIQNAQKGAVLTADGKGIDALNTLKNVLRRDHIRDAARKALFRGTYDTFLTFYLNKQVAFAGHVSFSEPEAESPLGPIKVTVETSDIQKLVDWLAPKTEKY
jgi:uncharacterized protein